MEWIEIFKAIILGIVQGITEWLPVSSTGHMILVDEFLQLSMSDSFKEIFFVVVQFGSILAVVLLYWKKIFPFNFNKKPFVEKDIIIMLLTSSFVLIYLLFIIVENHNKGKIPKVTNMNQVTYKMALIIGIFQVIAAVFPGTSRSGATIVGALLIGISREIAAEFTFFLAIPVMFGASLLKIAKLGLALKSFELLVLGVGTVVSFIVSVFVIKFLMSYIKKHDFKVFGWYRIILGIILLVYFFFIR